MNTVIRRRLSCVAVVGLSLAAGAGAGGCESGGLGGRSRPSGVDLRVNIPPQATEVAQGTQSLSYTVDSAGRLYLYNATRNELIGTFQVVPDQQFIVDMVSKRATLAGNEVAVNPPLRTGDTYRLYFLDLPE